uniref:LIM zinc-binding domain-containing protein n=1 Tax=Anopheles dirus TaxID=7168 RepID=A0A182NB51_9DIPT
PNPSDGRVVQFKRVVFKSDCKRVRPSGPRGRKTKHRANGQARANERRVCVCSSAKPTLAGTNTFRRVCANRVVDRIGRWCSLSSRCDRIAARPRVPRGVLVSTLPSKSVRSDRVQEKISAGTSHQHQSVTDYAKPNQGTSHYQSTLTTVSTTEHLPPSSDQLDSMLGNLTADMSRQGVNTTQKGCCNACDKPIVGQVITALGKTWHPEHFTCSHCNQELGTRNFFERDGNPYCEPDYHNLFSPRCAYCNGPILDKCVTALEKTWHTEHFFCAQCGQQFGEDGFHERDGKPYCRNDYFDMFAPKCNGCNRAIMENYISALNSQWHPDCFVCRDCSKPVTGKSFYAMEGKPVCPGCAGADEDE